MEGESPTLREHKMKIITFKVNEFINNWATEIIWKCINLLYFLKTFEDQYAKDKKCCKFRDHYHYVGECRGAVPKEIFIIFHNGNIEYWINTNIASLR